MGAQKPEEPAAVQDVDMETGDTAVIDPEKLKLDADVLAVQELREHSKQIEKAITSKEPRFILRVLRTLPNTRRKVNPGVLRSLANQIYPVGTERQAILQFVEELDKGQTEPEVPRARAATKSPIPEVDAYFHLLALVRLLDNKQLDTAALCSESLMNKIVAQNRRTLDLIAAKSYFYHSRVAELTNRLDSIRGFLHARLRTATLRNDFEGQAVIINCLLRNYLHYSLYDQADKLVNKSVFPEAASNNEWARFLYYLGRIKGAKLEYSVAHKHLVQVRVIIIFSQKKQKSKYALFD